MYVLLNTLWFVWELKYILFWLYLWQLKDYHIGRFIDHFRTSKGRKLILDYAQIAKLILFLLLLLSANFFTFVLAIAYLIYVAEFAIFLRAVFKKSVKKPVRTLKTVFLTAASFVVAILCLIWTFRLSDLNQVQTLIAFDVLTPVIISVIVLLFQPFFVALRNNTLRKAKYKMEKIKSVSGLKVVAITGSYGKTSTKEFLTTILSRKYKVLGTKEHQNSEIGVAKCILEDLKPSHEIFIAEVGAYNKGKVREVCSMLRPKIGIVTGVNEQHLALFGSLENLLSAEGGRELAAALPNDGMLVVNGDNKYCLDLYKDFLGRVSLGASAKMYSLSNKAMDSDIWADGMEVQKNSISFLANDKSGNLMSFDVKVLGKHNIQNLLGAILTARELGMSFGEISDACRGISQRQAGMTLTHGKYNLFVIDSSYSANPDGVFADLNYLSVFKEKRVVVMPCLIELGDKSAEIHEKIGKKIAEICDLAVITTKDYYEQIKKGATGSGMPGKNVLLCDKADEIYSAITLFCKSGDAVLLEGRVPAGLNNLLLQ